MACQNTISVFGQANRLDALMFLRIRLSIRLVSLTFCFVFSVVAFAQAPPPSAWPNLDPGLYQNAEDGDPRAQFLVACDYYRAKNYAQALAWYGKSAEQGYVKSQTALGWMYEHGEGQQQDFQKALKWLGEAAEQDDPVAETELAGMLMRGEGTAIDYLAAQRLLVKSASHGLPAAMAELAHLYSTGFSGNKQTAYKLCGLALASGQGQCQRTLEELRAKMAPSEIAQADEQTTEFLESRLPAPKPKKQPSDAESVTRSISAEELSVRLGQLYEKGIGVQQDYARSAKLYEWAANRGNSAAQVGIGELYSSGQGVGRDAATAVSWFEKAATQGDMRGQRDLGMAYLTGAGVARDDQKGVEWLSKAADQGSPDAEAMLGICYQTGKGVAANEPTAVHWYRKAAEKGSVLAMNNLSWLYATSTNEVIRNPGEALRYASKAVEANGERDPRLLDTLAEAYYANGEYDNAVQISERALSLKPADSELSDHLAKYKCAQNSGAGNSPTSCGATGPVSR